MDEETCELNKPTEARIGQVRGPTVTERLEAKKQQLEAELRNVNVALNTFKNNPGVQAAFDAVARVLPY